jgi:hypothetical protein
MTSVLRRYAQTDPKTGFFTGFPNDISGTSPFYEITVWRDISGQTSNSIMDISGFQAAFNDISYNETYTQRLFKDLGRQIVIYNSTVPTFPHVAIMRQVMLVNGYNIEGISDVPPFARNLYYICTWNDGSTATNTLFPLAPVARTG